MELGTKEQTDPKELAIKEEKFLNLQFRWNTKIRVGNKKYFWIWIYVIEPIAERKKDWFLMFIFQQQKKKHVCCYCSREISKLIDKR